MSELATHVEYAKSNRSECMKCHSAIAKDAIRIGKQFHAHHEGQRYYHLKCWNPKDSSKKPADYVFGFEHLNPKDQITVNKHCGFNDAEVVDPNRHVAGAATVATPAPASPGLAANPFAMPATSQVQTSTFSSGSFGSFASPFGSAAAQPEASAAFGAIGPASTSAIATSVTSAQRKELASANTLYEVVAILRKGSINNHQASYLTGTGSNKGVDAKPVIDAAIEVFAYDHDVDELLHTLSRVLRTL